MPRDKNNKYQRLDEPKQVKEIINTETEIISIYTDSNGNQTRYVTPIQSH